MPLIWMLIPVFQILCAIHAYKRGNTFMMYLVLFFPGVGVIIYLFAEYLPSLKNESTVKAVSSTIQRRLRPEREIERLRDEVALNSSVNNRLALADGLVQNGMTDEAISLYESCLEGVYKNDPDIEFRATQAFFNKQDYAATIDKCMHLRKNHSNFKPIEVTRLIALSHEATGAFDKAIPEYESILKLSNGEEIRCRYAQALKSAGRIPDALKQFETILQNIRISPAYYKSTERFWHGIAKNEIRLLNSQQPRP